MIGREHSSDRVVRPHDCKDADPHRRGPLVWMRQRTAVLSKTSHANCCTTLPNRPLRPREGRFVRVVQQLACKVFARTAVHFCPFLPLTWSEASRKVAQEAGIDCLQPGQSVGTPSSIGQPPGISFAPIAHPAPHDQCAGAEAPTDQLGTLPWPVGGGIAPPVYCHRGGPASSAADADRIGARRQSAMRRSSACTGIPHQTPNSDGLR